MGVAGNLLRTGIALRLGRSLSPPWVIGARQQALELERDAMTTLRRDSTIHGTHNVDASSV